MKAPGTNPARLAERHNPGLRAIFGDRPKERSIFLDRAEYVSADYRRRLVVEFDWQRAAADLPPWRARLYFARLHATSPNGVAWRLAQRARHYATLPKAQQDCRPWMTSATDTPPPLRPR